MTTPGSITHRVSFVVEESFQIAGRGVAIATSTSLHGLMPGTRYVIHYVRPDHTEGDAEATLEVISRRMPVASERHAMVVLNGRKQDLPPGTEVFVSEPSA